MDSSDYSPTNLQGPSLHGDVGEVSFHPAAAEIKQGLWTHGFVSETNS